MLSKRIVCVALLMCMSVLSCKKKESEDAAPSAPAGYDKKKLLANIGNNIIIPSYEDFKTSSEAFYTACTIFQSDVTEVRLEEMQEAWKAVAAAWKRCELYRIGPGSDFTQGYYSSIDFDPVNPALIESSISEGTVIDKAYIDSKGASVKGLPALEYLLFNSTGGNAAVLADFTGTQDEAVKRRAYLLALSDHLQYKAASLYEAWIPAKGNYVADFIASDDISIGSSVSELVNQMVYMAEKLKNERVGIPLGKMNSGIPQPLKVEAGESGSSLSHIENVLLSIEHTFSGTTTSSEGEGFDDMLDHLNVNSSSGELLSDKIKTQFQSVHHALDAVPAPLQTAVTDSPEAVEALYTELSELLLLIKVDMSSQLGVLLTISDNDGD